MPFPFHDYFYYSRNEKYAFLSLLFILFLIQLVLHGIDKFVEPEQPFDLSDLKQEIARFEQSLSFVDNRKKQSSFNKRDKEVSLLKPFDFDPNDVTEAELIQMGLNSKTIHSILNYRAKGGRFRVKQDLAKIYTLSEKHYRQLEVHIKITKNENSAFIQETVEMHPFKFDPNKISIDSLRLMGLEEKVCRSIVNFRNKGGRFYKKKDFAKIYNLPDSQYMILKDYIEIEYKKNTFSYNYKTIDVNKATPEDFEQFRGIGPSFAKRIIKYREDLGGFYDVKQLGEVYKLPDSVFQQMLPYLTCPSTQLRMLNINELDVEDLKMHPYLRWSHAKALVEYRLKHKTWTSIELVQILYEFNDKKGTYQKVRPYLSIQ